MIAICPKCAEQFDFGQRTGASTGMRPGVEDDPSRHWSDRVLGAPTDSAPARFTDDDRLPRCPRCHITLEAFDLLV